MSMKYDVSLNPGDENTSHALVVKLVGTNKRVLDIGCATGYLAEALRVKGNRVWGVEYDEVAAAKAAPHVEDLVVGDVESLDLVEKFGKASFDVLVFADVLEHLRDPTGVLERSKALLADDGFIVISIPNVAHSAVRLSLLKGRFDYQPLGLLDDTHLRFFTRRSLNEMIEAAGFTTVEELRTTAPPFETEIAVSPAEFPAQVVDEIARDPDSETYQFVLRVIPRRNSATSESMDEFHKVRASFARVVAAFARVDDRPTIGVIDASATRDPLSQIRLAVLLSELRRRLLGFELRLWSFTDSHDPGGLGDEPSTPLLPWTSDSLHRLQATTGEVIVVGSATSFPNWEPMRQDLESGAIAIVPWSPAETTPDVLLLAGRMLDAQALTTRRTQLVTVGALTGDSPVLLTYAENPGAESPLIELVESRSDLSAMSRCNLDPTSNPFDALAIAGCSDFVLTDSVALACLAAGLNVRVGLLRPSTSFPLPWLKRLGIVCFQSGDEWVSPTVLDATTHMDPNAFQEVDAELDRLARSATDAFAAPLERSTPHRVEAIVGRIESLERANQALRHRIVRERHALLDALSSHALSSEPPSQVELMRALQQKRDLSEEVDALKDEIDRIYATRTMRAMKPLRKIYRLVRQRRG